MHDFQFEYKSHEQLQFERHMYIVFYRLLRRKLNKKLDKTKKVVYNIYMRIFNS